MVYTTSSSSTDSQELFSKIEISYGRNSHPEEVDVVIVMSNIPRPQIEAALYKIQEHVRTNIPTLFGQPPRS
ncbi:hypothetical protein [Tolypothrix sp. VBCCA 56010]|uniref:hypothetical protein n=1 Tax=Tolypothrix sp. VBCCA 56010 TaxID=3137731 RepID=UPI003D7D205A